MIISVGELNGHKNRQEVIETQAKLFQNVKYVLVGKGGYVEVQLKALTKKLYIVGRVVFTGYRTDAQGR